MDQESRRKGPRSPSPESDDSHRRRSRKYDRSPSPRRSRYRRSRSRDRRSRSSSRDRRRKETSRNQDWKQPAAQSTPQGAPPASGNYQTAVHNQYQGPPPPNTGQPPPTMASYNQGYNYNYNYNQSYDYTYSQQPAGYRSDYPPPGWQGTQVPYNNQQPPPPPNLTTQSEPPRAVEAASSGLACSIPRPEDAKKEAIAAEVKQQKATLSKQREEYITKSSTLQRELEILRQQCDEISKDGSRDNNRILKENQKLQVNAVRLIEIEIQNKMKSIHNVIDMLTGIIGDKATVDDLKMKYKSEANKHLKSPKDDFPKGKSESPDRGSVSDSDKESKIDRDREREKKSPEDMKPMYNFVHYDPEMHWCKVCDIFPKTAKEYLNHLHSNDHKETCVERKIVDMPWHKANGEGTEKEVPYYPGLPTKRTPIKGLQFFISATAWYCKLCDSWIGDLHCASLHLKSKRHSENFSRFVEQNPHWETDWMADREKAFSEEKHKQMQIELLKQKEDEPVTKSKKSKKNKKKSKKSKKRRNKSSGTDTSTDSDDSFSDSDQDKSKSIRVAMRNKMKAATQAILNEEIDYHGIKLKGSWAQVSQQLKQQTPEVQQEADDRQLLNSIRDKLKAKQEGEMKAIGREGSRRLSQEKLSYEEIHSQNPPFPKKPEEDLEAWGPKEPPKSFWIKKEEEKPPSTPTKSADVAPKPEDMPKPHMGFWTKQQVNMPAKQSESKVPESKEEDRNRERGSDRYKDDRDRKYDRRDDKYDRYDRYDRRRGRDRDYHEDRRKREASPRRERNWRDSPKGSYDKYDKDRREDNSSNDESKFEKKSNEFASKFKKVGPPPKKPATPAAKGKLPFIGRLPLFKKKAEEPKMPEKDIAPLPYQQSKFEDTPRVPSEIINPPGVVHITKLATPVIINNGNPSQLNKLQQHMKILVAPPPPMLNESKTVLTPQVVDMEIEDQSDGVIIEQPIIEQQKEMTNVPKLPPPPSHPPPPISRPPFIQTPHVSTRPSFTATRPAFLSTQPPFVTHPPIRKPPVQNHPPFIPMPPPPQIHSNTSFVQSHTNPPPSLPSADSVVHDVSDIPEPTEKRADSSKALPEDFQEALNIIFPKEQKETKPIQQQQQQQQQHQHQHQQQQESVMYATMYSMLGCIGYGPEYMDQPPPEITQAEPEPDTQPGPDDLKMLGIDESDTIF